MLTEDKRLKGRKLALHLCFEVPLCLLLRHLLLPILVVLGLERWSETCHTTVAGWRQVEELRVRILLEEHLLLTLLLLSTGQTRREDGNLLCHVKCLPGRLHRVVCHLGGACRLFWLKLHFCPTESLLEVYLFY